MTSQGFFVLSPCQPRVKLLSVHWWHLQPHAGEGRREEPALSFCPSPPLPHPRGISPSCLSATSSELCWPQAFVPWVSQRCPQHSPDQRGAVPACYTWCPSKSFGLYIFLLNCVYISRSFVVLVCFVFFFFVRYLQGFFYICENKVRIQS